MPLQGVHKPPNAGRKPGKHYLSDWRLILNTNTAAEPAMTVNPFEGRGLVPLREATTWLGMRDSRVTMRLVREGQLKARKLGNRVMITSKSLRDYTGV